jgi:hypothetical protein
MSVNQIVRIDTGHHAPFGPPAMFLAALAGAAVTGGAVAALLHWDYVYPLIGTLMFVLAAFIGIFGSRQSAPQNAPSYLDVAGALLLIGLGVAALNEPQQLLRITGMA